MKKWYVMHGFYTKYFEQAYPIVVKLAKCGFAQKYHTVKAYNPNYWFTIVESVCTELNVEQVDNMVKEALKTCPNAIMEIYD